MTEKKARKNPWVKRHAKKKYSSVMEEAWNEEEIKQKSKEVQNLLDEARKSKKQADRLQNDAKKTLAQLKNPQDLIDGLTLKSLKDSLELERTGKLNNLKYKDLCDISDTRREVEKLVEQNHSTISEVRVKQIEILELQIAKILEKFGEKE